MKQKHKWKLLAEYLEKQMLAAQTSIFNLPTEPRLQIYSLIFSTSPQPLGTLPGLLKANKQIYSEAILLLYQTTTFTFSLENISRTLTVFCNLPSNFKNAIKCIRQPNLYRSPSACGISLELTMVEEQTSLRSIAMPRTLFQVGVRVPNGSVVSTNDPAVLERGWEQVERSCKAQEGVEVTVRSWWEVEICGKSVRRTEIGEDSFAQGREGVERHP